MLNDLEKEKIVQFCADEGMMAAVKKVLLAALYSHGTTGDEGEANPLINGAFGLISKSLNDAKPIDNEVLGQNLRAQFAGVSIIENAYTQLKIIKAGTPESVESSDNPAV